jgi:hypothetical protein
MHGSVTELFQGLLGEYSLAKYLLIVLLGLAVMVAAVVAIVRVRGQSNALTMLCVRDVMIGAACAVTVLAFPGFFFFVGRALWRASVYEA